MTMTLISSAAPLREALYALSLAKRVPDAELLDDVVRRFPQHADALTDFAIDLAMDALHGEVDAEKAEAAIDPTRVSPAVSRAMSHFQTRLYAASQAANQSAPKAAEAGPSGRAAAEAPNPFAALSRAEFRAFAERIGANAALVAKLRDRQIEPGTMTDGFRQLVAAEIAAPLDVVVAHFAARHTTPQGRQFFKADGKPNADLRQSFADAVRSSGLSEEQQRRLLGL